MSKVGLDDFLVSNNFDIEALLALEQRSFEGADKLWEINRTYAYIRNPTGHILRINPSPDPEMVKLMRVQDFHVELANRKIESAAGLQFLKQMGQTRILSKAWLEWPYRTEYSRMDYLPGQPRVLEDGTLNIWPGWPCEPKRGDISPFEDLFANHICKDASAADKKWLLQWIAYAIQNPGVKIKSVPLLIGPQGAGKNLVGEMISAVYGRNAGLVDGSRLHDSFNNFLLGRQFMVGDEVFSTERRKEINAFKVLITREDIFINQKHVSGFHIKDTINWLLLTNHLNPLVLTNDDRRYFVLEMDPENKLDPEKGLRYGRWLRSPEGAAALFYYFLKEVDCSGFNPAARPPMSEGKRNVIEASLTNLDRWARDVVQGGPLKLWPFTKISRPRDGGTLYNPCELFELRQLVEHFVTTYRPSSAPSDSALMVALRTAGAVSIPKLINLRGNRIRVWAVANIEKWKKARHDEVIAYLRSFLPRHGKSKAASTGGKNHKGVSTQER